MSRPMLYPERNAEIIQMRNSGMGPTEIANRMGIKKNVVIGVINRAGLCRAK